MLPAKSLFVNRRLITFSTPCQIVLASLLDCRDLLRCDPQTKRAALTVGDDQTILDIVGGGMNFNAVAILVTSTANASLIAEAGNEVEERAIVGCEIDAHQVFPRIMSL